MSKPTLFIASAFLIVISISTVVADSGLVNRNTEIVQGVWHNKVFRQLSASTLDLFDVGNGQAVDAETLIALQEVEIEALLRSIVLATPPIKRNY